MTDEWRLCPDVLHIVGVLCIDSGDAASAVALARTCRTMRALMARPLEAQRARVYAARYGRNLFSQVTFMVGDTVIDEWTAEADALRRGVAGQGYAECIGEPR
jgi:hypothetical protein